MKRALILLIGLIGVAYGQSSPTSAKTRFVNGLYVGTKLDSYFNAADSNAIYWRADSIVMAKYKGAARRLLFASDSSIYLTNVVRTFGTQTVGGNKDFTGITNVSNATASTSSTTGALIVGGGIGVGTSGINGVRIHRGLANEANSLAIGTSTMTSTTTGQSNIAIGISSLVFNTTGGTNTGVGGSTLASNTTGNHNTAIGHNASISSVTETGITAVGAFALTAANGSFNTGVGYNVLGGITSGQSNVAIGANTGTQTSSGATLTTIDNSVLIGSGARANGLAQTNQIVIGHSATGNGSNTVTIGNSSVTGNYFSGSLFSTETNRVTKTDNTVFGQQFYDANKGWFIGYVSNSADSAFQINYDGSYNTKLRNGITINKNGDVFMPSGSLGVGTTTAAYKLDVVGTGNFTGALSGSSLSMSSTGTFGGNVLVPAGSGIAFSGDATRIVTPEDNVSGGLFKVATGANIKFANASTEFGRFETDGTLVMPFVYTATVGGTNRDVFVDNTGLLGYVSSFRASKKNINPISNTDWLHKLNPVTFNYRVKDSLGKYTDSAYKELEYGLVAEEVEAVNKEIVFYDVDSTGKKQLRGVHYSKLIIPLLAEIQEHKKRLDAQDKIIEALLTRITALENKR